MKYIYILSIFLFSGCVTTREYEHQMTDPTESMKIRQQLRSKEDIDYFNRIQDNHQNNSYIYIE